MSYLTAPSGIESGRADSRPERLWEMCALGKVVILCGERILGTCGMSPWKGLADLGGQPALQTRALDSSQPGPVLVLAFASLTLMAIVAPDAFLVWP